MAHRLTPQWVLLAYLLSVMAITFIHSPSLLGVLLVAALLGSGRRAWVLLRKTLTSVVAFNLSLSLGYSAVSFWQGNFHVNYLLLVNTRVLLLVFLGFWLIRSIDLLAALRNFPLLRLIATLSISQIKTFERIIGDFQLAFESRNLMPPRRLDKTRHAVSQTDTLLDKTLASANQAALAMRCKELPVLSAPTGQGGSGE